MLKIYTPFFCPMKVTFMLRCILLTALTSSAVSLYADNRPLVERHRDSIAADNKIIYFGKGDEPPADSVRALYMKFYQDQFHHFQDPEAPYFLFMSKDSHMAMGMGGMVRMRGYLDWGGAIGQPAFAPALIPMEKDPARDKYLGTTPAGTALYFRLLGKNNKIGDFQLYIEMNFNGYQSRDCHLKKSYARINDWTIGLASSTFGDNTALPPVIDASGPNAKMAATPVLVRWMHSFKRKYTLALSVETPSDAIQTQEGITEKVNQWIPDFAAFGQIDWGASNHIRLAGILRALPYRNLITQRNHTTWGWGLQASTTLHPIPEITIYGAANCGHGYTSLGGDWLFGAYDLVPDPTEEGRLFAPFAFGGWGSIQYNFSSDFFVSATVSGARYAPRHNPAPGEYQSGLYMAYNAYYYLTPRISFGAEFNLGRRENFSGQTGWARRFGMLAAFSF